MLAETLTHSKTLDNGAHLASYAWLTPVTRRSGPSIRCAHTSHAGSRNPKTSNETSRLHVPETRPRQPDVPRPQDHPRQMPQPGHPDPGPPPYPHTARHRPKRQSLRPTTSQATSHRHMTHHIRAKNDMRDAARDTSSRPGPAVSLRPRGSTEPTAGPSSFRPVSTLSDSRCTRNSASSQTTRSEERRVGKECRSRWSPYH